MCRLYVHVETKYKERSQCRGRRAVLRLRRVFRTRMLVERGDEEMRRKRVDLRRRRTGVSLEYRLAPRDSAVDSPVGFAVSFPKSPSSTVFPRLFLYFPFPSLFSSSISLSRSCTIVGHESRMAEQVKGVAETILDDEILFQKNCRIEM